MPQHAHDDGATALDLECAVDTHKAAELLGRATITLQQMRAKGEGPRFFRIGRSVGYRLGDVLRYRDARMIGTAEAA